MQRCFPLSLLLCPSLPYDFTFSQPRPGSRSPTTVAAVLVSASPHSGSNACAAPSNPTFASLTCPPICSQLCESPSLLYLRKPSAVNWIPKRLIPSNTYGRIISLQPRVELMSILYMTSEFILAIKSLRAARYRTKILSITIMDSCMAIAVDASAERAADALRMVASEAGP